MPTVWRITGRKYKGSAFSGEGARLFGGRWNSPGTAMIYTAQSQSLAILEVLVHLDTPQLLEDFVLFAVEVDSTLITSLDRSSLPIDWKNDPVPEEVQALGDIWAANRNSVALSVPSVIVPDESNFLLNPSHPDFARLKFGKPISFRFDSRFTRT